VVEGERREGGVAGLDADAFEAGAVVRCPTNIA
jgi:hypothetical protein